jgi:hypothetical protein
MKITGMDKVYQNGPVTVTIDAMRDPLVMGFGGGARHRFSVTL